MTFYAMLSIRQVVYTKRYNLVPTKPGMLTGTPCNVLASHSISWYLETPPVPVEIADGWTISRPISYGFSRLSLSIFCHCWCWCFCLKYKFQLYDFSFCNLLLKTWNWDQTRAWVHTEYTPYLIASQKATRFKWNTLSVCIYDYKLWPCSTPICLITLCRRRRRWCLIRWLEHWRHDRPSFSRLNDPLSAAASLLSTDLSIPWNHCSRLSVVCLFPGFLLPFPWWCTSVNCHLPFSWCVQNTWVFSLQLNSIIFFHLLLPKCHHCVFSLSTILA